MIEFKKEWAVGMDGGEAAILSKVRRIMPALETQEFGQAIDYTLATVCDTASSLEQADVHLNYIIDELVKARNNIRKELVNENPA